MFWARQIVHVKGGMSSNSEVNRLALFFSSVRTWIVEGTLLWALYFHLLGTTCSKQLWGSWICYAGGIPCIPQTRNSSLVVRGLGLIRVAGALTDSSTRFINTDFRAAFRLWCNWGPFVFLNCLSGLRTKLWKSKWKTNHTEWKEAKRLHDKA